MTKKILIATGGTGGHVYPAIALAQQLKDEYIDSEILFVGGGLSTNKHLDSRVFNSHTVCCGTFSSKSPKAIAEAFYDISKGIWQSHRLIREFKPNVIVGFGSYYAFPPLIAAKLLGIPLVLHEANIIPGKVNRLLARWAEVTGVHFPETVHLLRGEALEVGMPLREEFLRTDTPQEVAREHFGLAPDIPTILVFGGSQGAKMINALVSEALSECNKDVQFQVLHLAGDEHRAHDVEFYYKLRGIKACVRAFEKQMQLAWRAANLVICRSGAGTIAEQLEFEVPGILIPYPKAAYNHQEHNADFMVSTVGGAIKLNESGLGVSRLAECVRGFLMEDGAMIKAMQKSMNKYKSRARTRDLCSLVKDYL